MAKTASKKTNIDVAALAERFTSQFRGLNTRDPSSWPAVPKYALCAALTALVVVALWFAWLKNSDEELIVEQGKEQALKEDYKKKLVKAVNLDGLKKQREQVEQYVTQLEKQLPSKAEMDALLSDINRAGQGVGLLFESFKPGAVSVKEYYAEQPIALRVTGKYHDMGAFAADIANLSRIVTLNNLTVVPGKDGALGMEATARTYRYLDKEEVAAQRKPASAAAKSGAKP